ncbi:MAG: class I SAM-dependent methyltransferase [Betaproteobacteria bacterium]|nr:class I SAM-dependent methyltransferase [Betaproteobacteria bacterium]
MGRHPGLLVMLAAALAGGALAAEPRYDVPYVPTPQVVVDEMLRIANVGPGDYVIDLGSGDGRIPVTAAQKFGARGLGVDLDPERVAEGEENARSAGVAERVRFVRRNLFETDIRPATVLTMYLLPSVNLKLRPRLLAELKPGTRIVSHDFDLGEWQPDRKAYLRKNVFLWIVPAQVAGRWRAAIALPAGERGFEIEFRQKFQEIDGVATIDGKHAPVWEPRLSGERISFVIVDYTGAEEASLYFEGTVDGGSMQGEIRRGVGSAQTVIPWRAVRK